MDDNTEPTLAEQQLETTQRVYDTGKRYGLLDARAGRTEPSATTESMAGFTGTDTSAYSQGWHEGYSAYLRPLRVAGTRVSVPSLVPGHRMAAVTTGKVTERDNRLMVEVITEPDGTVPLVLPVAEVFMVTQ